MPRGWDELAGMMSETDELGGLQFLEVRSSLPDELLMYSDKLSMANSLELRVPYLDQEIVEYAERLPASFKVRNGVRKWLHRRVAHTFLPADILRRKKRGFATNVVDAWFRGSLSRPMEELLSDPKSLMYQYLEHSPVIRMLADHRDGRADYHKTLFSLIVLELLLRAYKQWTPAFPALAISEAQSTVSTEI
jgi:asparagine synthase (glutamine-hydrolysing)